MDKQRRSVVFEGVSTIVGPENQDIGLVQIGTLARRVGVRVDTLRAWERRYGLFHPSRSAGGFRLYTSNDETIVRLMLAEMDRGYRPSQAAKLALARSRTPESPTGEKQADLAETASAMDALGRLDTLRTQLNAALQRYDGVRAHELFDTVLAEFTLNAALGDVVLPCLSHIGDAWAHGNMTVAEEHFASQLIRERLLALAREWDRGRGPRALLACPSGERHDIGLICLGLVLSRNGWRITFLGPDTPISALTAAVTALKPDLAVLSATAEKLFISITSPLRAMTSDCAVFIAGSGATPRVARATHTTILIEGPVKSALHIAERQPREHSLLR
jgi:MerR family transcriptional regulator, light-induced transcriptional regulator